MEYSATAKYVRMSPRKVRLLAAALRKLKTDIALSQLGALNQPVGKLFMTVLNSAIANAKQKQADLSKLSIKTIDVMEGPVMKRWHAASRGMAHPFKKRMTHIRIVLMDEQIMKSANAKSANKKQKN